mmetsp:Transcript_44028/g.102888  ORF Transcript_44028/g.102888 Transcript_44028/m.102888 type:complete len:233 (+) Transcript_44028:1780-2478(+)
MAGKRFCKPRKRVVLAGDGLVHQALAGDHLLPGFDAHLHKRHQGLVLCQANLRLLHHKPFSSRPRLVGICHLGPVKDAHHAHNRHGVLAEGQLFQEIVSLEHDVAHTGASQPRWLVSLELRSRLQLLGIHWVKGEKRLAAGGSAHLQGQHQVLQVHSRRRLKGRCNADAARCLIVDQAAKALGSRLTAELFGYPATFGHRLGSPADLVLQATVELLLPPLFTLLVVFGLGIL